MPAYWVTNLNMSYQMTKNIQVFGLVRNLFNQHYYLQGTFFDTGSFPYLNLTDPRTFFPGLPSTPGSAELSSEGAFPCRFALRVRVSGNWFAARQ